MSRWSSPAHRRDDAGTDGRRCAAGSEACEPVVDGPGDETLEDGGAAEARPDRALRCVVGVVAFLLAVLFGVVGWTARQMTMPRMAPAAPADEVSPEALLPALAVLGVDADAISPLGDGFFAATLKDAPPAATPSGHRRVVLHASGRHVSLGGLADRLTGQDVVGQMAERIGALPPSDAIGLSSLARGLAPAPSAGCDHPSAGSATLPTAGAAPETARPAGDVADAAAAGDGQPEREGMALVPPQDPHVLSAADMAHLRSAPATLLHPGLGSGDVPLVVFTYGNCPNCTIVREWLERNRNAIHFQVAFVPVVGADELDRSALEGLGLSGIRGKAREEAAARLLRATQILLRVTGGIMVPAFAYRDTDGSLHLDAGMDGTQLMALFARLNG